MNEISFGASGAVTANSASKFGKMAGARLVVTASITDFEENTKGSSSGSRAKKGGILGLFASGSRAAYMAVNIEVVDVQTSELVASEQMEAEVTDTNIGALIGNDELAGALSGWEKQPRGKALQKIINAAVQFLSNNIPESYFTEKSANNSSSRNSSPKNKVAMKMQRILKDLGYYNGAIDGGLGPMSQKAIRTFQEDYDLETTGMLSAETTKKLLALSE